MTLAPPDDIVAALRDYGCKVKEWPGWRTRGRPYPFDPYGQAWHHDAFSEGFSDEAATRYIAETGRPDLPAPLANGTIGNYGVVTLTAYGNANHAGLNMASVLARLKAGLAPLGKAVAKGTVVGNPHLWGWECRNAGTGHDPWEQLDTMERAGAAMADCCGWSPMAQAGHLELTSRKIDPKGFNMHAFRADSARIYNDHRGPQEDKMEQKVVFYQPVDPKYGSNAAYLLTGNVGKWLPTAESIALVTGPLLKIPLANSSDKPLSKVWQDTAILMDGPCVNVR